MKVYIETLYEANNVGAFLQAYSLQTVLQKYVGKDNVEFIKMPKKNGSGAGNTKLQKVLFYLKQREFRKVLFKYKTSKKYCEVFNKLNISKDEFDKSKKYEMVVVGSDEVWNLASDNFTHHEQYFAKNISSDCIISYAPSANETTVELVKENKMDFSGFKYISVRDEKTYNLVRSISGITPQYVCDPTLLVDDFGGWFNPVDENNYILVYSYGMDKESINEVKRFAKENKKKLISVGTYNSWCDNNIVVNPFEFLGWLKKADYVIASTFHGTVLSVRMQKNVIVYSRGSHKINHFLNQMNLLDRNMSEGNSLNDIVSKDIDYKRINRKIEEIRKDSIRFIEHAIDKTLW